MSATCDRLKPFWSDYLGGGIEASLGREVEDHLDSCTVCACELDASLRHLGVLESALPRWQMTDERMQRSLARFRSTQAFSLSAFFSFRKVAALSLFLLLIFFGITYFRHPTLPAWTQIDKETLLTLSDKTKILLSAGTEYRLEGGAADSLLRLYLNRGEAVLAVQKKAFHEAGVVLPSGSTVNVTGTFFLVRTIGAYDFAVELLEGGVRINSDNHLIDMAAGKSAVKEKERLVVSPMAPHRETFMRSVYRRLFPSNVEVLATTQAASPVKTLVRSFYKGERSGVPPASRPPAASPGNGRRTTDPLTTPAKPVQSFYDRLRNYEAPHDTGRYAAAEAYYEGVKGSGTRAKGDIREEQKEKESEKWSMPQARPYAKRMGVEIWNSEVQLPVRWYEEIGEMEFKFGKNGADLEAMAVRKSKRIDADGFIILASGPMNRKMAAQIEFRRGRERNLEVVDRMHLDDYGIDYQSDNFSTLNKMTQDAWFMRVKFFRYYK